MRFYPRKTPKKKADMLIDQISSGFCDDTVVRELKAAVSENSDPAELERVITALMDVAMKSSNVAAVAYSVKALVAFHPLTVGLEDDLETRLLTLAADNDVLANKRLREALTDFIYVRVSERVDRAKPFIGVLIQCLDDRASTAGTTAYNALMTVAANQSEYFEGQAGSLIKMLGSINNVTRIQTSKLIAVLALSHPEYVADAEKILLDHSSFNPDGEVKSAASEAYQILSTHLHPEDKEVRHDDSTKRQRYEQERAGGLAEIMRNKVGNDKKATTESRVDKRLLSMATNFAKKGDRAYDINGDSVKHDDSDKAAIKKIMNDFSEIAETIKAEAEPVTQPAAMEAAQAEIVDTMEEAELRKMMEMVQDDFSITAGSILDAIGVGHLAKKEMTEEVKPEQSVAVTPQEPVKRARMPVTSLIRTTMPPEKVPEKIVDDRQEISSKEFIASIESIMSRTENSQPEAPAIPFEPAPMAQPVIDNTAPANHSHLDSKPVNEIIEYQADSEVVPANAPAEVTAQEKPVADARQIEPERRIRIPIVPPGVRISAMKFKSVDQSKAKKPAPAKISIKAHIKPLNRQPSDAVKSITPPKQPVAPIIQDINTGATEGYVLCRSCGAKMPVESQRCAICGTDLKSPKTRCRKCGEINPRQAGKCGRCGSAMDE